MYIHFGELLGTVALRPKLKGQALDIIGVMPESISVYVTLYP